KPFPLGEEHWHAFILTDKSCVAAAPVAEVRRQQRIQVVILEFSLQGRETSSLHDRVAMRRCDDLFFDPVSPLAASVDQLISRNACYGKRDFVLCVPLFLREEVLAVGDDQTKIAGARIIQARVVDLIENAVAESEPNPTRRVESRTHAALCA